MLECSSVENTRYAAGKSLCAVRKWEFFTKPSLPCARITVQSKICNVGADSGGEWGSEGLRHITMEFWAFSDTSKPPPPLRLKGLALKNTLENWQSSETIKKYSLYYTLNVFNNLSSLSGKKMKNTEELQDCLFKICFLLPLDVCAFVIE